MTTKKHSKRPFIFFCLKGRQAKYQQSVAKLSQEILFVSVPDLLIQSIIERPPAGVLVDIVSGMRIGTKNMIPIYNLNLHWPVLRCNISSNGSAVAMDIGRNKGVSLSEAVNAISSGDSSWFNSAFKRNTIRIAVPFRVKIFKQGGDSWNLGNIMNLCHNGSLVHTCDPPKPGERVSLEIMDLSEKPTKCAARTVWARRWEESVQLPCAGFSFDQESFDPCFKKSMADLIFHSFKENAQVASNR